MTKTKKTLREERAAMRKCAKCSHLQHERDAMARVAAREKARADESAAECARWKAQLLQDQRALGQALDEIKALRTETKALREAMPPPRT